MYGEFIGHHKQCGGRVYENKAGGWICEECEVDIHSSLVEQSEWRPHKVKVSEEVKDE